MDHAAETYALVVPEGVVTYNLRSIYDEHLQRVGSYPADGRLHRHGTESSVALERAAVERYIAEFGAGSLLQASL
jgi:hypothetical protein